MFKEWSKGNRIVWEANPNYWGDKAKTPTLELHWSDESAARLRRPPVRHRRRHRQPRHPGHHDDPGRLDPEVLPARRAEHAVPRLQQHAEAVRRRAGPPGDRHGHRPRPDRQELLPRRARPSPTTSRRARSLSPAPATRPGPSTPPGPRSSSPQAGFPDGQGLNVDINFRAAVRGYNPNPPVIATEIAQQLKKNLGIDATPKLLESGAMIDGFTAGHPQGSQPDRLGR